MASTAQIAKTAASRDAIHRALPGPNGDQWTTAQALADATGLKYSTTTEHLRAMVDAGTVAMDRQGRVNVFRKNAASPKLKATDVVTPRAAVAKAPKPPRRRHGAAPPTVTEPAELAPAKKRRPTVTRGLETVELPPADGDVWMATRRAGLHFHHPAKAIPGVTVCGRSMRTGVTMPLADVPDASTVCRECGAAELARASVDAELDAELDAEAAAEAPGPAAVPQPPPAANTPTGGDVGSVVDYLERVRPTSAPPAEPVQKARRPKAETKTYAVFGRGKLQDAILTHVQALAPGDATPYQVATALNAYPGAVAYGLGRLVVKGNVRLTSDKPQRYAAV